EYDQPVLVRLGTEDKEELRGGFPKDAEDLFGYHAVVLDDIEAGFFTQDQLSLLQRFVGQRGGGLLMMGGKNSFQEGGYARSAVGSGRFCWAISGGGSCAAKITRRAIWKSRGGKPFAGWSRTCHSAWKSRRGERKASAWRRSRSSSALGTSSLLRWTMPASRS